jgi:hypothetical protein
MGSANCFIGGDIRCSGLVDEGLEIDIRRLRATYLLYTARCIIKRLILAVSIQVYVEYLERKRNKIEEN